MGWFIVTSTHAYEYHQATYFVSTCFLMCISHVMCVRRVTLYKQTNEQARAQREGNKKYQPIIFLFFLFSFLFVSLFLLVFGLFHVSSLHSFGVSFFCFDVCRQQKTWIACLTDQDQNQNHSLDIVLSGDSSFELSLWWGCVFLVMLFDLFTLSIHRWRRRRQRQRRSILNLINWIFVFNSWLPPSSCVCVRVITFNLKVCD